jgi:hypothetical protein
MRTAMIVAALACWGAVSLAVSAGGDPVAIAIIVHPSNDVPDPSTEELRAIFRLARQFWPSGRRVSLLLPPSGSVEKAVLLDRLYGTDDAELRKFWVGQLFRGTIPAIPSTLRSIEAVIAAVRASEGGIAAVPVSAVPPDVRVLRIDGKEPRDPDYPLRAQPR